MSATLSTAPFVAAFDARGESPGEAAWLTALRRAALTRFAAGGLPSPKLDSWKYTSARLGPVANSDSTPTAPPTTLPSAASLDATGFGALDAYVITVIDGTVIDALSKLDGLPAGVFAGGLAAGIAARPELVRAHLGATAELDGEAFATLNLAFTRDGVLLHLPRGTLLKRPVHIRVVATSSAVRHPRCLLVAEANAEATLIESYVSAGGADYTDNAVTQIVLGDGARLRHLRLQDEAPSAIHLGTVDILCGRDSDYHGHLIAMGASVARTAIHARLASPGATARLSGLSVSSGNQHEDTFALMDHAAPHCTSEIFCKKVLDGSATTVFNAKALVRPGAQKTDANQQNKNLLLSARATANTLPQLEIYADDVKCAHGATVGQLDADQIFYLRARGIGLEQARRLLTLGFANEILAGIEPDAARVRLEALVERRFAHGATA